MTQEEETAGSDSVPAGTSRLRDITGTRGFKLAIIGALLLGTYAIVGFLAAPKWIRVAAQQATLEATGEPLGLGEIRLNPFLLTLTIADISLPDRAGAPPLLALDRLLVDVELASIWNRALVFREIDLTGPFARVIIEPDKTLNLARLARAPVAEAPPEPSADREGLPPLWIQRLVIADGRVNFADHSRHMTPEKEIAPIGFTLRDFRTDPRGGTAKLDARSERGEGFAWEGRIALAPIASQGRFSVTALKARTLYEFLSEELPLELVDGTVDLAGSYELSIDPAVQASIMLPELELRELAIKALDADEAWLTIPAIKVSETALATSDQSLRIARLTIERPAITAWLEPDGSLNLMRLAGTTDASEDDLAVNPDVAVDDRSPETEDGAIASAWTVELAEFALHEATVDFEDRTFTPPNPTKVAPLTVNASGISLDLARRITVALAATVNDRGQLEVAGELAPQPLSADLEVAYENGSLAIAQPYVSRMAALTVREGRVDFGGKLSLRPEGGDEPWLRFAGDITAGSLNTIDNDEQRDLVNFDRLDINGIDFALAPDGLTIEEVVVARPFARVIVAADQSINVIEVFETAEDTANGAPASSPDAAPDGEQVAPFPVAIVAVKMAGGTLDFTDFFIQPNFAAKIDALNGEIEGLSSDPASRAKLALKGQVISEFSPVSISGTMNLFSFDRYTDIDMEFRNIDLPIFNPYSGKFAGYAIAKGKLTTELAYMIEDRNLEAQHRIVIDRLEWGVETGSEDAVSIPIKLATALLKDRNGVIELDFPVGGSLDDPSFRIGPVIWQVIRNLLVKIVTAPFAFIGSLFAGAENAQFVTFAPGTAELSMENAESLAALAKALLERPQLKLEVPVRRMPEIDGPALARRRYEQEVRNATRVAMETDAEAPIDFESLPDEQRLEILTTVYTVLAGATPTVPEPPPPPQETSRADARMLATAHAIEYLDEANRSLVTVSDGDLLELAEARAQAIQRALLEGASIGPERIFITASEKVTVDGEQVRLELALE